MCIVVLGNRLVSESIHEHLKGRVDVGVRLLKEEPDRQLLMCGGETNPEVPYAESEVMKRHAVEKGADPDRVLTERRSKDTVGNAYFARRMVEDRLDTSRITLVTSSYHLARSIYVFEHCFGDEYDVRAPDCYESSVSASEAGEARSMSLNRQLFAGVQPGDMATIRRRMIDRHALYSAADFDAETI